MHRFHIRQLFNFCRASACVLYNSKFEIYFLFFVWEELAPPVAPNLTFLTTLANPALSLASYCYAEFAFSDLIFREGQAFLITNF